MKLRLLTMVATKCRLQMSWTQAEPAAKPTDQSFIHIHGAINHPFIHHSMHVRQCLRYSNNDQLSIEIWSVRRVLQNPGLNRLTRTKFGSCEWVYQSAIKHRMPKFISVSLLMPIDRATVVNAKSTKSHCPLSLITRQLQASVDSKLLQRPINVGYYNIFER